MSDDTPMLPPRSMAPGYNPSPWIVFLMWCALILAALALIAVIIGSVVSNNQDGIQRYYVQTMVPSVEGGGAIVDGQLTADLTASPIQFSFLFYYYNTSLITAIVVRGPRLPGQRTGAPLLFDLCGAAAPVCDVTTVPGAVGAVVTVIQPGSAEVRPYIIDIRSNPTLYYLEILTANHPTSPGGMVAYLGPVTGTPVE
jgi:hypothetical protein